MDVPASKKPLKLWHGLLVLGLVLLLMLFVFAYAQQYWGLWGMVVTELGLALVTILAALFLKADFKVMFPFKRVTPRLILGTMSLWGGAYLATLGVTVALMILFPKMSDISNALNAFMSQDTLWLQILAISILPGVCEEMMHRGFILTSTKRIPRTWIRVLYMGVVFGVFHMDPYRFLPTALLGAALTYIMIRTENFLLPILYHAWNNLFPLLINAATEDSAILQEAADTAAATNLLSYGQALAILGMALIPLLIGFILLRNPEKRVSIGMVVLVCLLSFSMLFGGAALTGLMLP